jgi:hypothetical protein
LVAEAPLAPEVPPADAPFCALVPVAEVAPGAGAAPVEVAPAGGALVAVFDAAFEPAVAPLEAAFEALLVAAPGAVFDGLAVLPAEPELPAAPLDAVLLAALSAPLLAALVAVLAAGAAFSAGAAGAGGAVGAGAAGVCASLDEGVAAALSGVVITGSGVLLRPNANHKIPPRTIAAPMPISIGLDGVFSPSSRGITNSPNELKRRKPFSKGDAAQNSQVRREYGRIPGAPRSEGGYCTEFCARLDKTRCTI